VRRGSKTGVSSDRVVPAICVQERTEAGTDNVIAEAQKVAEIITPRTRQKQRKGKTILTAVVNRRSNKRE